MTSDSDFRDLINELLLMIKKILKKNQILKSYFEVPYYKICTYYKAERELLHEFLYYISSD